MSAGPYTVMAQVVACLCEQLEADPVCYCGMTAGVAVMPQDVCLCGGGGTRCGTAWVRLDSSYPSSAFPMPDSTPRGSCAAPITYRIHVGVARCVPGPTPDGRPPSADAMNLAVQRIVDDQQAALRALQCCMVWGRGTSLLASWAPVGAPDGNCAGGFWQFSWSDLS